MCLFVAGAAFAKPGFERYIPNSNAKNLWGNQCQLCHTGTQGGSLNEFGEDVKLTLSNGLPNWAVLSKIDSDSDGFTNGHELGDPQGTWRPGSSISPFGTVTNPSDASSYNSEPTAIQRIQVPTTWAVIKVLFR